MGANNRIRIALLSRRERRRSRLAALEAAGRGASEEAAALRHRLGAYAVATKEEAEEPRRWRTEAEAARGTNWREYAAGEMQRKWPSQRTSAARVEGPTTPVAVPRHAEAILTSPRGRDTCFINAVAPPTVSARPGRQV